jgi:cardiolipin synthase C
MQLRLNRITEGYALFGVPALFFLLSSCATLPSNVAKPLSSAFSQPQTTALGQITSSTAVAHAGQSGFRILDTGRQALRARLALIEAAQHALDLQYYIWNSDASGAYMARRILLAADRGVRVRLLLDDVNIGGRDPLLAALDTHPNIEVRIFNPVAARKGAARMLGFLGDFNRLNRRMHNKIIVADGALGIVGGRNIGDEYFDLHAHENFRDRDMLAAGPIVQDISRNFDAYWNSAWAWPVTSLAGGRLKPEALDPALARARAHAADHSMLLDVPPQDVQAGLAAVCEMTSQLTWANAELVYDPPVPKDAADSDTGKLTAQTLGALTRAAQHEVLIESAYFILGDAQLDNVRRLTARGVKIRALTNSLASNDLTTNHAGYARRRTAMLAKGLELHELRPDAAACVIWIEAAGYCGKGRVSLHAKSVVFDRKILYVGSFNINLRSVYLNSETVLVIHSPQLAERVARDIELGMAPDNSWQVSRDANGQLRWSSGAGQTWTHEPDTTFWRRFTSGLFGLLPMEKYL